MQVRNAEIKNSTGVLSLSIIDILGGITYCCGSCPTLWCRMFNSILGPHDAGSTPAVMLIKNASCGTKSLLIENHRSGEIGASKNSWEPGLSVRTQIKAVSQDMKEKTIANRFQSWNPLDSVSKCRG